MGSVLQGEACKAGKIPFQISPWYLLGSVGTRPGATRVVRGGMGSGSRWCPAQLGRGRAAVGPGLAWAGSPKKASPCLSIPSQPPFQDLLKPGAFLLQETPILSRAPRPAAEALPCLAAHKQARTHQETAFS